jgi:hypothetical protein
MPGEVRQTITLNMQKAVELIELEFNGSSDRAAAIVSAALLDSKLEHMLRARFVPSSDSKDRLFDGPQAILSTFSARIAMAYRAGLISDFERQKLDFVRDIRNRFAHAFERMDFMDRSIADKCRHHELPIDYIVPPLEFKQDIENNFESKKLILTKAAREDPRGLFKEVVIYLMEALTMLGDYEEKRIMPLRDTASWCDLFDQVIDKWRVVLKDVTDVLALPMPAEPRKTFEAQREYLERRIASFERAKALASAAVDDWKTTNA